MNPSPPIIEIHGDDVTVEASYLAARFDLSVDRLRAEVRRGIIYSVVERGMGEDAGRLRLTFRYRARLDGGGPARRDPERGAVATSDRGSHQPSSDAAITYRFAKVLLLPHQGGMILIERPFRAW